MPRHVFTCGMSRSGTTLLTTILDSHPAISMGYELLPTGLPPIATLVDLLDRAAAASGGNARKTGNLLREWGHDSAGVFVKRCARTLVEPADWREILGQFGRAPGADLESLEMRASLSLAVVRRKMEIEATDIGGFKMNAGTPDEYARWFSGSVFLYILRDPRDVVASQRKRGFERTVEEIARSWNQVTSVARSETRSHPERCALMRYEDLVLQPGATLREACRAVGLPFADSMLRFFESKASIHHAAQRHVNAENLSRDFFTSSIERWREELDDGEVHVIERICGRQMLELKYACTHASGRLGLSQRLRELAAGLRSRAGFR